VSVRSGILAVLSLGPAYGLQLHGELELRMNRAGSINVGQIYSTLDRLQARSLVEPAGTTDDGLPLYSLTAEGRAEAEAWLSGAPSSIPGWQEFTEHVLLSTTIPHLDATPLIDSYRTRFAKIKEEAGSSGVGAADLAAAGELLQADAALAWLDLVAARVAGDRLHRPLGELRPRRGRRPGVSSSPARRTSVD
jgi:DNA-binding PadR family transcriptional regulator